MATAKTHFNRDKPITLKLTQDEADLIFSVFGDLYTRLDGDRPFGRHDRERDIVSDIWNALKDKATMRSYRLELSDTTRANRTPF